MARSFASEGCVVFDPWQKPGVRGLQEYGREGVDTAKAREEWTFEDSRKGAKTRSKLTGKFWETLHIDLRMVDTSDFTIAYCPTNIYSVGTPHEIALCRQQRKPVLFVSPPVEFPALDDLRAHLAGRRDENALKLLAELENQVPIKPNPTGIPSLWYMPLVGGESFFDGFGFDDYRKAYKWPGDGPLDRREKEHTPKRPLLRVSRQPRAHAAAEVGRETQPLRQKRRLAPVGSPSRGRRCGSGRASQSGCQECQSAKVPGGKKR